MLNLAALESLEPDPAYSFIEVLKARLPKQIASLHASTDRQLTKFRNMLKREIGKVKNGVDIDQLVRVYRNNPGAVVDAIPWDQMTAGLRRRLEPQLLAFLGIGGRSAAKNLPGIRAAFDITNPISVAWAKTQSSTLVKQITDGSRKGIRSIINRGFDLGITPASSAREIREVLLADVKAVIGLTDKQAISVQNRHMRLLAEGRSVPDAQRLAERYARLVLNRRTKNIARTETINAASEGQLQLWQQMKGDGLISDDRVKRWIVTPDDRLDSLICMPMGRNGGQTRELNEAFTTGLGDAVMRPTAHPQCRCAMILVKRPTS